IAAVAASIARIGNINTACTERLHEGDCLCRADRRPRGGGKAPAGGLIGPWGYIAGALLTVGSFLCLEGVILLSLGDKRQVILRAIRSRMGKESPAVDRPPRVLYHQHTGT
ncbi:MAG: hypothetical protein ACI4MK_04335, partial [Aristaeellaceae bacterium]